MIVLKKDLNENFEPVVVEKKFINYHKLGEYLAYQLCLGYEAIIEIENRFGDGTIYINRKNGDSVTFIEFEAIKVEDIVQIEYNKLGTVKRLYK